LTYTLTTEHFGGTAVLTLFDDFDPDIDNSQWASIQGAIASTNCGAVSGNALYFRNSPRLADTVDLDVTNGGLSGSILKSARKTTPIVNALILAKMFTYNTVLMVASTGTQSTYTPTMLTLNSLSWRRLCPKRPAPHRPVSAGGSLVSAGPTLTIGPLMI
jgi:hypothetical protein